MTTKEYSREYYATNKEKWKVYNDQEKHNRLAREYYHRHKMRLNPKKQQWDEDNYEGVLWRSCKTRARNSGLVFEISKEDITIPEKCPYLNIPLTRTQGKRVVWTNASVDRIDNTKGYIKGNIQVISRMANSMKQHATQEQLIEFAFNVLEMHRVNQNDD